MRTLLVFGLMTIATLAAETPPFFAMDTAAKLCGEEGEFAIITGTLTAGNLNAWRGFIEARLAAQPEIAVPTINLSPMADGVAVYDAIYQANREIGIERLGWRTYLVNHVEGGFPQMMWTFGSAMFLDPAVRAALGPDHFAYRTQRTGSYPPSGRDCATAAWYSQARSTTGLCS